MMVAGSDSCTVQGNAATQAKISVETQADWTTIGSRILEVASVASAIHLDALQQSTMSWVGTADGDSSADRGYEYGDGYERRTF